MRSLRQDVLLANLQRAARESRGTESFFSKHFVAILNTVASLLTFALGYALVTVHGQRVEAAKLELDQLRLIMERSKATEEIRRETARLERDLRQAGVTSAEQLAKWVTLLHGSDANQAREAALALGMGGRQNVRYLVAPFLDTRPLHFDAIKDGLRVSGLFSHAEVCNTLCVAARFAEKETAGQISRALADLRCVAAIRVVDDMARRFGSPRAKAASEDLKRIPVHKTAEAYSECESASH